jgi:hypothetical protein
MSTTFNALQTSTVLAMTKAEAQAAVDVANQELARLLRSAFADGDGAIERFNNLASPTGPDELIRILESDLRRWIQFGFAKRSLFNRAVGDEARKALALLPEAMRDQFRLSNHLEDITRAHRAALERERLERHGAHFRDDGDQARGWFLKRFTTRDRSR